MSHRPIIDAGPGLNFLSINKERLLIDVLGPLSTPETVQDEVLRKARQDGRFRAAAAVWQKLSRSTMSHRPVRATRSDKQIAVPSWRCRGSGPRIIAPIALQREPVVDGRATLRHDGRARFAKLLSRRRDARTVPRERP